MAVEEAPVDVVTDVLQHRELRFEEHCVVPVPLMAHETAFELKVRKLRVKERYSVVFVEVVLVTIHRNGVAEGAVQHFAHVGPPEIHPGSVVGGDKKLPAILTGDFNVDQTSESYQLLDGSGIMRDSYEIADFRYAPNGTFNGFHPDRKTDSRIDHLFLTKEFEVKKYGILTDTYRSEVKESAQKEQNGNFPKEVSLSKYEARTPSDHFPVMIVVEVKD